MNVTILAANGQIAHLVEERLLTEPTFKDIQLTLMLRHPERLSELNDNPRVTLLDGDLTNPTDVIQASTTKCPVNLGTGTGTTAVLADQLLAESGLTYTTLRLPWPNDRPEVNYTLTHRHDQFVGVSGSRRSIADPSLGTNDSLGIDDPTTEGATRPVY